MKKPDKYAVEVVVSDRASDEEIGYKLKAARHELARGLLEQMHNGRYYTVRLDEHWPTDRERCWAEQPYGMDYGRVRYGYTVTIREVEQYVMAVPEPYEHLAALPLTRTAVQELKYRFKRWISRMGK